MDGILIIDKPENYTSRDIVNIVGKKFKTKKVGHTGTLDPLATGVLVVCINKATKVVELLTCLNKEYIAEFEFGTLTDTLDITGNILKDEKTNYSEESIVKVLNSMLGEQEQTIPLYSAVKINGKKLYEYARNGEDVVLPKHKIKINSIELLEINQHEKTSIKIKVEVSKGTYIRSLGNDIGKKLNTYGTMTSLRRTKQGSFDIKDALDIEEINSNTELLPIEICLKNYHTIIANEELEKYILDGRILENKYNENHIFFVNKSREALALYKIYDKDNTKIKPWKMFKVK